MYNPWISLRNLVFSRITRDTSVVLFGNALSSTLAVMFTILAARSLGPEGWGIVAAVGSLLTILVAFADLGIGAGLFRFVSKRLSEGEIREARQIIQVSFSIRVISALSFAFILVLLSKPISQLILSSNDPRLVIFAALGMVGSLLIDFHIALTEAKRKWKKAAFFIALTNFLRVILSIYVIANNQVNFGSILAIFCASPLVAALLVYSIERIGFGFSDNLGKVFREIGLFSGIMGANRMVSSINSRIDVLLLVNILGAYETGIYAAANRLAIGVPIILGSFATVLAPRFSSASNKEDSLRFFKRAIGLSTVISIALFFGVIISPYIMYFFGPEYERSSLVLQFLLASFIPAALSVPAVNLVIYGIKKPQIITLLSAVQLPIIIFVNMYFIPKVGVLAPVVALFIVNLTTMIVSFSVSIKYLRS